MNFRTGICESYSTPLLCVINILSKAQVARLLSTEMLMWPMRDGFTFSYTPSSFFWSLTFSYLFIILSYPLVICKYFCSICCFLSSKFLRRGKKKKTPGIKLHWFFVFPFKEAIALGKCTEALYCYTKDTVE